MYLQFYFFEFCSALDTLDTRQNVRYRLEISLLEVGEGLFCASDAEFFYFPVQAVVFHEYRDRTSQLFDVPVGAARQCALWEFDWTAHYLICLQLRFECKARSDTPEFYLVMEMIREILASIVLPQSEPAGKLGV